MQCNVRGRASRSLSDERVSEAQSSPLKLRISPKWFAFCAEFDGAHEDVRTRECDCLIRTNVCKENKQTNIH
eukprot:8092267-Heterocapsa_arctica.AAC.1